MVKENRFIKQSEDEKQFDKDNADFNELKALVVERKLGDVMSHRQTIGYDTWKINAKKHSSLVNAIDDIGVKMGRNLSVMKDFDSKGSAVVSRRKNVDPILWEDRKNNGLNIRLGLDFNDTEIILDLNKYPHLLIGGMSGSGKSQCIFSVIKSIGDEADIYIIDPKSEFDGINDDEEKGLIDQLLTEITRLMDFRNQSKMLGKPIVVIIDELPSVILNEVNKNLIENILRKGRSADIHVIAATQSGQFRVIPTTTRGGFTATVCFKMKSEVDGRTMGAKGAHLLDGSGEGMLVIGQDEVRFVGYYHVDEDHSPQKIEIVKKIERQCKKNQETVKKKSGECEEKIERVCKKNQETVKEEVILKNRRVSKNDGGW